MVGIRLPIRFHPINGVALRCKMPAVRTKPRANPLPNRLTLLQPPTILCLVMQAATRTFKYRLKVDDRVVLHGITTDLRRREREHRRRWPHARIEQVGEPTSHREAWEWEQQVKRGALSAG